MTRRLLAASALLSAAFLGGTANADCVFYEACYRNVTVYEDCLPQPKGPCKPVAVQAPLCWGGSMWTTGFCWY